MAGCGYIFLQRLNCSLIIINSVFSLNSAKNGGVFYLAHNLGSVYFINNTFTRNIVESDLISISVGGVFYFKGTPESFLILFNNSFLENQAERGGVYASITGNINESYSIYKGNFLKFGF